MENPHIDIERMIMQSQYKQTLNSVSAHAASNMSDMERKDYEDKISELFKAVTTLLDHNKSMGRQLEEAKTSLQEANVTISKANDEIEALKAKISKLEGENAMRRRKTYGKSTESSSSSNTDKGKTKDERESDFIEKGCKASPDDEEDDDEEDNGETGDSPAQSSNTKRDMSNRPDHYKKMHADVCVVHDCDMEKLKELGYEFIRYSRPVDQFDRISVIRQDRYLYAWVRDGKGNEFEYFVPKTDEERPCIFENESKYDLPKKVPHTSCTSSMLADLIVNRYQYAISTGREKYRMANEKMYLVPQTILNWLGHGAGFLSKCLESLKKLLLTPGSSIYCDETWVDTKVKDKNGKIHYQKRYMWVIVNMTTKVSYYMYGRRKRKVIEDFLKGFTGTLMTDAYAAYTYFCKLKDCVHVCCWAHVRRIFDSALRDYKDGKAKVFIDLISCLYKVEVENLMFGRTEKDIVKARRSIAIPVLNELIQKANSMLERYDKKLENMSSKLHQALTYMVKNWKELIGYVNVGNVQIDNNCCERAVRPFTNLRKSFGGFSSENGARTAATILSFVETCKLMNKNVLGFFKDFFDMVVSERSDYDQMALDILGVNKK